MADNLTTQSTTLATVPASSVVATDDVAGVHYQKVKIVDARADGTNALAVSSDGAMLVSPKPSVTRLSASSAGLTTATTAYTAGDQLGTILSWSSAVATSGGYGYITKATLLDKAKIVGAIDLYLFDQSVTLAADNGVSDFSDSDMDFCVGVIQFPAPTTDASNGFAAVSLLEPFKCNVTTLYGALVTRYAHTFFGAVGDLVVKLWIES